MIVVETPDNMTHYYCSVNLLNGYIEESTLSSWKGKIFFLIGTYRNEKPLFDWNVILTEEGVETSWGEYIVKSQRYLTSSHEFFAYYLPNDSLCVIMYSKSWNQNRTLFESNLLSPPERVVPVTNHPSDLTINEGEIGIPIRWVLNDSHPRKYWVYRNGEVIQQGDWKQDEEIVVELNNLLPGTYNYTIVVQDTHENSASDTVIVDILDVPNAPIVELLSPTSRELVLGIVRITWSANDLDNDPLVATLYYWDSQVWVVITSNLTENFYDWDTTNIPNGVEYKIRIVVSGGVFFTVSESIESFQINNPQKRIIGFSLTQFTLVLTVLGIKRNRNKRLFFH